MSSRTCALLAALALLSLAACAGKDGAAGGSCSVVTNGDGTVTIHCPDGTTGTVGNGAPGTPCTISDLGGGQKRIDCGDTSATLSDGAAGAPGTDGTSCTVAATSATERTITCGGTSVTVTSGAAGANGTSCTVTDLGGGASRIDCTDGTSVTVRDGAAGAPGVDGTACTVSDLGGGTRLISCTDGTAVTVRDGANGLDGTGARVGDRHGADALAATALRATGKYPAAVAITAASAAPGGALTVDFTVADALGHPVTALSPAPSFTVARLQPPAAGGEASQWVPYLYRIETVTGDVFPNPAGTAVLQGARESTGTLVAHGDGSYTYTFAANLAAATEPLTAAAIPYLRSQLHRVALMLGGAAGPTADATFDFVPDGSAPAVTREILDTAACRACHGPAFAAHGGDRLRVETCVTCHVPGTFDAQGGQSLDFKVMIHKIHAGGRLASIPGPDGIVFDNPATPADESADNGHYALWGFQGVVHEWWKAGFPAELGNCQKCHQGTGAQVDAWKAVPTRAACGSCHDTVDFASGANHAGGPQPGDQNCTLCHQPDLGGLSPVTARHDWTTKDPRNLPEFGIALSVSVPANGAYFVAGEAPVVTLQLTDLENGGAVVDHGNLTADPAAEGCLSAPCPAKDGLLAASNLFVAGPRARRNPVLTTKARTAITSPTIGPWDISAAGATLDLKVDGGLDLYVVDATGADRVLPGSFSVPVSGGSFASTAAATGAEVVAWLNANAAFRARAIASLEPSGRVSVRSRNLGATFSLQLGAGAVNTAVFGNNTAVRLVGGSTVGNSIAHQANPANNDPKVTWSTDHVSYQLDPVDDLAPGTYVVSVEISDRGRISATNYKTPSVGKVTFQVKTAAEELPVARNCQSCHQGPDGRGLVLDPSRHNKILSDSAVDQCGACHDYQPQTGLGEGWTGANPISRRVHAVHMGAFLNYPLTTVAYANGDPVVGRNWAITYPQDVRRCESCHPAGTTSDAWRAQAGRLACMGCHDSLSARAHLRSQVFDPTPADPWSGDEQEACKTCH